MPRLRSLWTSCKTLARLLFQNMFVGRVCNSTQILLRKTCLRVAGERAHPPLAPPERAARGRPPLPAHLVRRSGVCGSASPLMSPRTPCGSPRELRISALFFRPRRAPPLPLVGDSVFGKIPKRVLTREIFAKSGDFFLGRKLFLEKSFFSLPRC